MGWQDYWDRAAKLQLSPDLTAGSLLIAGGLDKKVQGPIQPDLLLQIADPYHFSGAEPTAETIRQNVRNWMSLRTSVIGLAGPPRIAVDCPNPQNLPGILRLFQDLSPPMATSVLLPDSERPVQPQWPLRVAVSPGPTFALLHGQLQRLWSYEWLKPIAILETGPAGGGRHFGLVILPAVQALVAPLSDAATPFSADSLLIVLDNQQQIGEIWRNIAELRALTQAQSVLVATAQAMAGGWVGGILFDFSHNHPWDVAVHQAAAAAGLPRGSVNLFATETFLRKMRLSSLEAPIWRRIAPVMPKPSVPEQTSAEPTVFGDRPHIRDARRFHEAALRDVGTRFAEALAKQPYEHESGTATMLAETIRNLPPRPEESRDRFVLARMNPTGQVAADPSIAVESGKEYELLVQVGPPKEGFVPSDQSLPEPPLTPEESTATLSVLFYEPNSCPEGLVQTIQLPRAGYSSLARFRVTIQGASPVFDARITIFHQNRPLMECAFRIAVRGAAGESGAAPAAAELRTLMRTRAFDKGLGAQAAAAGSLRIEEEKVFVVRGFGKARISVAGYTGAVQAMEKAINDCPLENIAPFDLFGSQPAARLLVGLAQQGTQLHDQLMTSTILKQVYQDGGLITALAADAETRLPLELCYSFEEPVSDARICPQARGALNEGRCPADCERSRNPSGYVCPMGFWGLQRPVEWRSIEADEYDPATQQVSPSPERAKLAPLRKILYAHSDRVTVAGRLTQVFTQLAAPVHGVESWSEWKTAVDQDRPSLLLLMPHVDKKLRPPEMEISGSKKDPRGVKPADVGAGSDCPLVLILGCGAATATIDLQSLPNQFRRAKAAVVIAPIAEILARDAPELAATFLNQIGSNSQDRPLAEVILEAKRAAVRGGYLAGLLMLSFGDADWRI